jgi:GTP diphosphokinase / guanosine-3',5'-bis(diphosphate) 3'-diphosphatase
MNKERKMYTTPMIEKAKAFATKAHEGQVRKTGEPFITHPAEVARLTTLGTSAETAIAAAWLHDTVEDCGVAIETISAEFGADVAAIVALLTKNEGEDYFAFIMRLRDSTTGAAHAARLVKIADMTHNLSTWPEKGSLRDKWLLGRELIHSWTAGIHRKVAQALPLAKV